MPASLRVARTTGGMVLSSGKGFEAQPKRNKATPPISAQFNDLFHLKNIQEVMTLWVFAPFLVIHIIKQSKLDTMESSYL
jgi:hypothetical protein